MPPKKSATETAITITQPQTEVITTQTVSLEEQAKAVVITDKKTADNAVSIRAQAKTLLEQIGDTFDPLITTAHKAHKDLLATKKKFTAPVDEAISHINGQLRTYEAKKEQERRAEEMRLQEQARKDQEAAALAQATLYQQQGNEEAAEEVIREVIESDAPTVVVEREKIEGVSFRTVRQWEFTDLTKVPLNFLQIARNPSNGLNSEISTTGIGAMVRSMGKEVEKIIPGIRVIETKTVV